MIFSSVFFIFVFLPAVLLVYFLVPARLKEIRNLVLFVFSIIFYAWGEPIYIILMLFSTVCNYFIGIQINSSKQNRDARDSKITLIFAVVFNLFILGFFKYYGFVIDNINAILPVDIPYKALALPIGISFYTFQTMSYIIDLYRGNVEVQKNYLRFALYVTMFPQLIAGPIVKYADIAKQLVDRRVTKAKFGEGVTRFVIGLGKKVFIANNIGMLWSAIQEIRPLEMSVLTAWLGALAFTMQIYFDFSGYSDMAIGMGKMFGFDFYENFNYPYISRSITEFWRRWHISLSSWFRDYVYIPLGGNRVSAKRHVLNLIIVWFLTGLWHGAAWNFIVWGLYYGAILILEKYVWGRVLEKLPGVIQHIYSILLFVIGWVIFASDSVKDAFYYIGAMFGGGMGVVDGTALYYLKTNIVLFIIAVIACLPVGRKLRLALVREKGKPAQIAFVVIYVVIFLVSVAFLVTETYNPFLYFRF